MKQRRCSSTRVSWARGHAVRVCVPPSPAGQAVPAGTVTSGIPVEVMLRCRFGSYMASFWPSIFCLSLLLLKEESVMQREQSHVKSLKTGCQTWTGSRGGFLLSEVNELPVVVTQSLPKQCMKPPWAFNKNTRIVKSNLFLEPRQL